MTSKTARIVVLGAGYAGLRVVRGLAPMVRQRHVDLTVINRHGCHELITLLHLAATDGLPERQAAIPLERITVPCGATRLVIAEVKQIDAANGTVCTSEGSYRYDRLVAALGSEPTRPDIPGLTSHSFTLRTLHDAHRLRDHIRALFAAAGKTPLGPARKTRMRFVVVGGGATGCQLAGELAHWVPSLADTFRVPVTDIHLVLAHSGARLMSCLPARYGETALRVLANKAVDVWFSAPLRRVEPHAVWLGETRLPTDTVIWTGGVRASRLLGSSGLPVDSQGRVLVDGKLRAVHCPEVYVVGDAARFEVEGSNPLPATAGFAIQQGDYVAEAIRSELHSDTPDPFHPQDDGMLVSLGGRDTVGNILGAPLEGPAAGWIKEGVERSYVAGLSQRPPGCINAAPARRPAAPETR